MRQRRQPRTYVHDSLWIDVADDNAGAIGVLRDDFAPRIDEHRMSPCASSTRMRAALRRCEHVALVFDRASAKKCFPMCGAGWNGERRGYYD